MKTMIRSIAVLEAILLFPAVLFFGSLIASGPRAQGAVQIAHWYTAGPVWLHLWILLMLMPLAAVVIGVITLAFIWQSEDELRRAIRSHFSTLLLAGATVTAALILTIVAVHAGAN